MKIGLSLNETIGVATARSVQVVEEVLYSLSQASNMSVIKKSMKPIWLRGIEQVVRSN